MMNNGPGGYVVVLFGGAAEGWCSLNKCPMSPVSWFETRAEAHQYCSAIPDLRVEPHVLKVERLT